jgi:hypothetical protein
MMQRVELMVRRFIPARNSIIGLCLGLLAAPSVCATTFEPLSLEQLCQRADVIIRAQVIRRNAVATSQDFDPTFDLPIEPPEDLALSLTDRRRYHIHTLTQVRVLEVLDGELKPGNILEIRSPGGRVGMQFSYAIGTPELIPGEEVLLFLKKRRMSQHYSIVSLAHGCYRIRHDPATGARVAIAEVAQSSLLDGSSGQFAATQTAQFRQRTEVSEFAGRIRSILSSQRQAE